MSQEQPRRPQEGGGEDNHQEKPVAVIKYGDVFNVTGELALGTIAPGDAALMQISETTAIGRTFQGGPAEKMLSAAAYNERAGVVNDTDISDVVANHGMDITQTAFPGGRMISESLAGQMVGQYVKLIPGGGGVNYGGDAITIGVALEAAALAAGNKPVDQNDAAAIQAAEIRATGSDVITPGGIAAAAQSAANANASLIRDEDKCKLADILTDAAAKLPADKPATQGDAEGVMSAELRNNPNLATYPVGVAEAVVSAARINQQRGISD